MTLYTEDTVVHRRTNAARSGMTCCCMVPLPASLIQVETEKTIASRTFSVVVTVLAAALAGLATMPSYAAEYTPTVHAELRSAPTGDSSQCSMGRSPLPTGCAPTDPDRVAQTTSSMRTGEGDLHPCHEQIDVTRLLEDLIETGTRRF